MTQQSAIASPAGFLAPALMPAPLEDPALTDFFQALVAGITGFPGDLVFPRWQEEPPNLPAFGVNWAAIGIVDGEPDTYAATLYQPGTQQYQLQRHEQIDLLASFYGPCSRAYAQAFSDGLQIPQNREVLTLNTMGLTNSGRIQRAPARIKNRWTVRDDLPFRVKRGIKRVYTVPSIEKFQAGLEVDGAVTGDGVLTYPLNASQT